MVSTNQNANFIGNNFGSSRGGFDSPSAVMHQPVQSPSDLINRRIAGSDCAILLSGETGTGKGYLARWIHEHSPRAKAPFVPVNCGAIPESLIDSHLFGHARGAFSGAQSDHLGLIRAATGGTLLLDEIGELPSSAQLRLLRLLEEREVQTVGHSKPMKVDVRVIACTNGDLTAAVQSGKFRQDLFFRLDVVRMHLKPLRVRRQEIAELLAEFNAEFAGMYRRDELEIDRAAMTMLSEYHWPGNVRELRTVVERLHVMLPTHGADGERTAVGAEELKQYGQLRAAAPVVNVGPASLRMAEFRVGTVNQAIEASRGNMSRAAGMLGVHRSTLYRWLAEHQPLQATA